MLNVCCGDEEAVWSDFRQPCARAFWWDNWHALFAESRENCLTHWHVIVAHARTRASSVTSAAAMRPAQRARRVAACLDRGSLVTLGVLVNQIRGTLTTIV